jgi:hypothetical protein
VFFRQCPCDPGVRHMEAFPFSIIFQTVPHAWDTRIWNSAREDEVERRWWLQMELACEVGPICFGGKVFLVIYEAILRPLISISCHQELSTCFHTLDYTGAINASVRHILQPMYDKPVENHQQMRGPGHQQPKPSKHRTYLAARRQAD